MKYLKRRIPKTSSIVYHAVKCQKKFGWAKDLRYSYQSLLETMVDHIQKKG